MDGPINEGLKILLANVADVRADAVGLERLFPADSETYRALDRLMEACDQFWSAIDYEGDPSGGPSA